MTCFISTYAQVIELSICATKQVDHYQLFKDFDQEDDFNVSDWDKDSVSSGIDFKADAISTSNDFALVDSIPSTRRSYGEIKAPSDYLPVKDWR